MKISKEIIGVVFTSAALGIAAVASKVSDEIYIAQKLGKCKEFKVEFEESPVIEFSAIKYFGLWEDIVKAISLPYMSAPDKKKLIKLLKKIELELFLNEADQTDIAIYKKEFNNIKLGSMKPVEKERKERERR